MSTFKLNFFCLSDTLTALDNFLNLFQQQWGHKTMTYFIALCEGLKRHDIQMTTKNTTFPFFLLTVHHKKTRETHHLKEN